MKNKLQNKVTFVFLVSLFVSTLNQGTAQAVPLTLNAGDSVSTASNPNDVLRNPLTNAVLISVTNSNNTLMTCGNVIGAVSTAIDLSAATGSTTVGAKLATEASRPGTSQFTYNSASTYSTWCIGPSVSPYYFSGVKAIQLTFPGGVTAWALTVGPNSFVVAAESSGVVSSGPTAEQIAAIQAAIAQAKVTLVELFKTDKPGTFQQYRSADYIVKNEKVVEKVNAAILKLSIADRSDASKIAAIVNLENFIDLVSTPETQKYVTGQKLVQLGLVEKTSKNKASIANKLKKADSASVNTIEKIQEAIAAELKVIAARADRRAAIKAKIAERNK